MNIYVIEAEKTSNETFPIIAFKNIITANKVRDLIQNIVELINAEGNYIRQKYNNNELSLEEFEFKIKELYQTRLFERFSLEEEVQESFKDFTNLSTFKFKVKTISLFD